jgi:hypothetical protein
MSNYALFFVLAFPAMALVGVFVGGMIEGLIFGRDKAQSSVGRLNGRP